MVYELSPEHLTLYHYLFFCFTSSLVRKKACAHVSVWNDDTFFFVCKRLLRLQVFAERREISSLPRTPGRSSSGTCAGNPSRASECFEFVLLKSVTSSGATTLQEKLRHKGWKKKNKPEEAARSSSRSCAGEVRQELQHASDLSCTNP